MDRIATYYRDGFSKENVLVLPFEMLKKNSDEFIDAINAFSGLQIENLNQVANESLEPGLSDGIRRVYRIIDRMAAKSDSSDKLVEDLKDNVTWFVQQALIGNEDNQNFLNHLFDLSAPKLQMPPPELLRDMVGKVHETLSLSTFEKFRDAYTV